MSLELYFPYNFCSLATLLVFRKNINCSITESLERFKEVMDAAKKANIRVRG